MKPTTTRDIYSIVTDKIIEQLEQGLVPWKQPWADYGLPRNLVTQRPYRGINYLLLKARNFPFNEFLTFNQVKHLGGSINKGEKGTLITYWLWHKETNEERHHSVRPKTHPTIRYYFVFNISQCSGILEQVTPAPETITPIECCEKIVNEMQERPRIVYNEPEAYYHLQADYINMPKRETFSSIEDWYVTLFHELIHSTAAEHRLNRPEALAEKTFGSDPYSKEELIAEMGACYLAAYSFIATPVFDNNVAYIQFWLNKLKEDKRLIVQTAAIAQRAADYILNIKADENEPG